jgi:hypothetical protein
MQIVPSKDSPSGSPKQASTPGVPMGNLQGFPSKGSNSWSPIQAVFNRRSPPRCPVHGDEFRRLHLRDPLQRDPIRGSNPEVSFHRATTGVFLHGVTNRHSPPGCPLLSVPSIGSHQRVPSRDMNPDCSVQGSPQGGSLQGIRAR